MLGGLVLVSLWLLSLIWGLAGKVELAVAQAHDAKRQYQALEARRASLQENMDALSTPLGQDAAIRTAFGVARPGEEVMCGRAAGYGDAATTPGPLAAAPQLVLTLDSSGGIW